MNTFLVMFVPFLFFIFKIELIPIVIFGVAQYFICKKKPKYNKIIPIFMGITGILAFGGIVYFYYISGFLDGIGFTQYVLFYSFDIIFCLLPTIIVLIVTKFTKYDSLTEIDKMKINDL